MIPEGFTIKIEARPGLEYRWHGFHTVNVYLYDGMAWREVDVLTIGTPHEPTFEEVLDSIQDREADRPA